jgi:rhodanese-related sulfurtransferase
VTRVLALLAVLATLLVGCTSDPSAVTTVDAQEFVQVAAEPQTTVIDVRTPQEYASGHLVGAVNVDVEDPGFAATIKTLDPEQAYAVYCRSGRRSALAADTMAAAGFTQVTNLSGGLVDLQAAGGQVVSGSTP